MNYLPYLLGLLFYVHLSLNAQTTTLQDDFEGNGDITTWFGDDCDIQTNFTNPFPIAINTSSTVLRYHDVGGQYANVRFEASEIFDLSMGRIFSLKVYVPTNGLTGNQPLQISLKLQDGSLNEPWITQSEIIKPIVTDRWQTVTFDFARDNFRNLDGGSLPPTQRTDFNRVVIQINGENNNDQVVAYLDDISYGTRQVVGPVFDQLVWSDEFDNDGPVDSDKWFAQSRLPDGESWFNGEIQHYTNRIDNAQVANGTLRIIAKRETFTDQGQTKQFTSARLNSRFAFQYGRVEVRAKMPFGVGTWPAIWMLGKNINENGAYWQTEGFGTTPWPDCGEIDIMEHWGNNQNYISSAIHTPSSFGATVNVGGRVIPGVSDNFHVYTAEWTPDEIVFSVDGVIHYVYNPPVKDATTWPFDAEQYLILNVAIQPGIATNFTTSAMEVDYVRVYQSSPVATEELQVAPQLNYYPNPVTDELRVQLPKTTTQAMQVELFQADGKRVQVFTTYPQDDQLVLASLGRLTPGIYIVRFEIDEQAYSIKVIKK